ncbi:5834_t:CDS:2 [Acaulospora colombiana]|uniref:5834_t:CDS:1 n=1 Tax=Acaulospora colombiana TaxID=27376 RepID=A0ACA9MZD0_9GLOM|nr:5834_t:CDS:2 [Acaulospora colombiana]
MANMRKPLTPRTKHSHQGGYKVGGSSLNGLIETNMDGKHPLLDLIEKGEQKWTKMISRWKFVKENGVILVDERDIEPYFALSPRTFQSRVQDLAANLPFSFSLVVTNGSLSLVGERANSIRAKDIADLVEPFAQWLPDLQMHASDHDRGNIVLGQDQLDKALELVTQGEC